MLQLVSIFNADKDIKINDFLKDAKISDPQQEPICSPKIIGQESDGTILFTWDAKSSLSKNEAEEVTHFGIYDMNTQKAQLVFVHDRKLNVANGTINAEHTFLGFVTIEVLDTSGAHGRHHKQSVYRAFVAEIRPQNRVFYLNLERAFYLKLQFVYTFSSEDASGPSSRESHMLVFLHRDSIGLYHLPIARVGEGGVIMSGEPRKEQVFLRYWWSQYDATQHRLYVMTFKKTGRDSRGHGIHRPHLTAFQLLPNSSLEKTLEMFLDLPIPYCKITSRCSYHDTGFRNTVGDRQINLQVLSQSNGALCVCYQHSRSEVIKAHSRSEVMDGDSQPDVSGSQNGSKNSFPKDQTAEADHTATVDLQYSVLMVHHGRCLTVKCCHLPANMANTGHIFFSWIGEYLLAYMPGCFSHLLNVSVDLEPCNHLLWHDTGWMAPLDKKLSAEGVSTPKNASSLPLVPFIKEKTKAGIAPGLGLFDPATGIGYKMTVDERHLVSMFEESETLACKVALLHFAVVHAKDIKLIKSLLEILCQNISSFDVLPLLQEFLIGSTFAQIRRHLDRHTLKCLPYSTSLPLHNEMLTVSEKKLATVMYHDLKDTDVKDTYEGQPGVKVKAGSFWSLLFSHRRKGARERDKQPIHEQTVPKPVVVETDNKKSLIRRLGEAAKSAFSSQKPRLSPVPTVQFYKSLPPQSQPTSTTSSTTPDTHHTRPRSQPSRPPSRTEQVLGSPPPFLGKPIEDLSEDQSTVLQKTVELLTSHMIKYLPKESSVKVHNMAEEYVKCQMHQSRLLIHVLWSIMAAEAPAESGLEIYPALERYYVATEELSFPRPPAFQHHFNQTAYRLHDLSVFLQYVDRGIFTVTEEFVMQLIKEDGEQEDAAILQLISRLPRMSAVSCLQQWSHPVAKWYIATHYTAGCLGDEHDVGLEMYPVLMNQPDLPQSSPQGGGRSSWASVEEWRTGVHNPPLTALLTLLQSKASITEGHRGLNVEYLQQAALQTAHLDNTI